MYTQRGERGCLLLGEPAARCHCDLEVAECRGPRDVRGRGVQLGDTCRGTFGRDREAIPTVRTRDRPLVGALRVSADDDRDRLLDRSRICVDSGEVDEAAVKFRMVVVPEVLHRVEILVGDRAAILEVGADRAELGLEIAHTDAEHRPAVAQHVEGRELLREHDRVALREDHDAGRELDRRGVGRGPREREQRIERRVLRCHR